MTAVAESRRRLAFSLGGRGQFEGARSAAHERWEKPTTRVATHGRSNRSMAPKSPPARRCIDRGPVRRQSQSTMPFRGYWDDEEEQALRDAVQKHGIGSWEKMRHDPDFKVLK